jgi:ABC-type uncharacterized transport system substrate-binding protein
LLVVLLIPAFAVEVPQAHQMPESDHSGLRKKARIAALPSSVHAVTAPRRPMPYLTRTTACILLLLILAPFAGPAFAHPHVWVSVHTEVEFGPNREILGFKHKWTFDEFYSEFAIQGLDANGDGIYSEEELKPLAQTNIEALKEFEYFTFAFDGEAKLPLKDPVNYRLEHKDKLLTLYFTLPLSNPLPADKLKYFSFAVYDPGMYVAMSFEKATPVTIASAKTDHCEPRIGDRPSGQDATKSQLGENVDPSSNVGMQFAERVTIICK